MIDDCHFSFLQGEKKKKKGPEGQSEPRQHHTEKYSQFTALIYPLLLKDEIIVGVTPKYTTTTTLLHTRGVIYYSLGKYWCEVFCRDSQVQTRAASVAE